MISIAAHDIDAFAPNAGAISNGRKLAAGKVSGLSVSDDGAVLFGKCSGSGKSAYDCSVDFADPHKPVGRCSCPSRQIPCKHCLALLYAWDSDATQFAKAALPEELHTKRAKAASRAASRKTRAEAPAAPKKTNVKALAKKLQTQLDGLDLLERILFDMLRRGFGTHGSKESAELKKNAALLKAAYLPGAELALHRLSASVQKASDSRKDAQANESEILNSAMDELARLETLIRRGRAYLEARIADVALAPETDSSIAAWLGHAWQYEELQAAGLGESGAEFLQLTFFVGDDVVKKEYADTAIWMHLGDGRLLFTETLRPYKAVSHIKAEDSYFDVAQTPDFVRYPGEAPQRARWRGQVSRSVTEADYAVVRKHAAIDFAVVLKSVRNALKSPLGPRWPVAVLMPARYGSVTNDGLTQYVVEDDAGTRIRLADATAQTACLPETTAFLPMIGNQAEGAALLCLFHFDAGTFSLAAQPLALIHADAITRLAY